MNPLSHTTHRPCQGGKEVPQRHSSSLVLCAPSMSLGHHRTVCALIARAILCALSVERSMPSSSYADHDLLVNTSCGSCVGVQTQVPQVALANKLRPVELYGGVKRTNLCAQSGPCSWSDLPHAPPRHAQGVAPRSMPTLCTVPYPQLSALAPSACAGRRALHAQPVHCPIRTRPNTQGVARSMPNLCTVPSAPAQIRRASLAPCPPRLRWTAWRPR